MLKIFFALCFFLTANAGILYAANEDFCNAAVLPFSGSAGPCTPTIVKTNEASYTNMTFLSGSYIGADRAHTWYRLSATGEYVDFYPGFEVVSNMKLELFASTLSNAAFALY